MDEAKTEDGSEHERICLGLAADCPGTTIGPKSLAQ